MLAAKASDWHYPPTEQPGQVAEAASMPALLEDLESYRWFKETLQETMVFSICFLQTGQMADDLMHI